MKKPTFLVQEHKTNINVDVKTSVPSSMSVFTQMPTTTTKSVNTGTTTTKSTSVLQHPITTIGPVAKTDETNNDSGSEQDDIFSDVFGAKLNVCILTCPGSDRIHLLQRIRSAFVQLGKRVILLCASEQIASTIPFAVAHDTWMRQDATKWKSIDVLLIDEIHRMSSTNFVQLANDARRGQGKTAQSFGKLQVIATADFHLPLPFVRTTALTGPMVGLTPFFPFKNSSTSTSTSVQASTFGDGALDNASKDADDAAISANTSIFETDQWIETFHIRQLSRDVFHEPLYAQFLLRMRAGKLTETDIAELNKRSKQAFIPPNGLHVYSTRKLVQEYNESRLDQLDTPLETFAIQVNRAKYQASFITKGKIPKRTSIVSRPLLKPTFPFVKPLLGQNVKQTSKIQTMPKMPTTDADSDFSSSDDTTDSESEPETDLKTAQAKINKTMVGRKAKRDIEIKTKDETETKNKTKNETKNKTKNETKSKARRDLDEEDEIGQELDIAMAMTATRMRMLQAIDVPLITRLRIHARVALTRDMTLPNTYGGGKSQRVLVRGSIGTVVSFITDQDRGIKVPVVRFDTCKMVLPVHPQTWTVRGNVYPGSNSLSTTSSLMAEFGALTVYATPLVLAFAISMAALQDLPIQAPLPALVTRMDETLYSPGQAYLAASRVYSLQHLYLTAFKRTKLKTFFKGITYHIDNALVIANERKSKAAQDQGQETETISVETDSKKCPTPTVTGTSRGKSFIQNRTVSSSHTRKVSDSDGESEHDKIDSEDEDTDFEQDGDDNDINISKNKTTRAKRKRIQTDDSDVLDSKEQNREKRAKMT